MESVAILRTVSYFIACDFDGTVTLRDTLHLIVQEYAPEAWATIEPRLVSREIGLLEAVVEEFRHVRVSEDEVVEFVLAEAGIRAGFGEFVHWAEEHGHGVVIVSAGFEVLIRPVLEAAGLSRLEVYAGNAEFSLAGTVVSYPETSKECASQCGQCKSEVVAQLAPPGATMVHIGDGLSDLCVAREADIVFARGSLAHLLSKEDVSYYPFEDFFRVVEILSQLRPARE